VELMRHSDKRQLLEIDEAHELESKKEELGIKKSEMRRDRALRDFGFSSQG
jgi:hypothetical protein